MRHGLILICLLFASVAQGQTPVGDEFQVNTYTSYNQVDSAVAMNSKGGFIVVWASGGYGRVNEPAKDKILIGPTVPGQDGDGSGIFGQRYDNIGTPLGTEFQINTYTTGDQRNASVASDDDGNFVVVWESYGSYPSQDGSGTGIFGQRYASDGGPIGGEFQVNSYTTNSQIRPSVAMDSDGDFVVTWDSWQGFYTGVFAQMYASDGNPTGGEFLVNSYTTSSGYVSSVGMDGDGDFAVAWQGPDGSSAGIHARLFGSDGSPVAPQFQVNSYTTYGQRAPSTAMDSNGNFVVAWDKETATIPAVASKNGIRSRERDIHAQRFAANGNPVGGEFQVNSYTIGYQALPSVAMSNDGEFVVAWESGRYFGVSQDGSYAGIFVQQFNSDGTPRGTEVQANNFTLGAQASPAAAMDADGDFIVSWNGPFQDGSNQAVLAQLFTPVDGPLALRANGNSFSAGEKLEVAATVINDGIPATYDIFFVALWPDFSTVIYWGDWGVTVGIGSVMDTSTWVPYASNVDFTTPFVMNDPDFFAFNVSGAEPAGDYNMFLAAVVPGGFADGTIDPADIVALGMVTFTLNPAP